MAAPRAASALFASILILTSTFALGFVAASHDRGLVEVDGDVADGAAGLPYDWATLFAADGTPLVSGAPLAVASFAADHGAPDPTYHANSDKDVEDMTTWQCAPVSNPQDKTDLLNGYSAAFRTDAGHYHLYFGVERATNNGNSFVGAWFLQNEATCQGTGSFSRGHTEGDLLVLSDFTGGGSVSAISIYRWNTSASNNLQLLATGADCATAAPDDAACGRVNVGDVSTPWAPGSATPLPVNTFFEAGLNLSALLATQQFPCLSQFMVESRSSQELSAQLKDYASGSLSTCDARISVSPLAATNVVGDPHTFTFLVEKDPGTGWVPAAGELVTANITAGPGTFVGPSTCTTDAQGQCSVTIVSTTSGATTLSGSVDVVISATTIHRETDGTRGSSGPAVKTWLKAPSSAVSAPTATSLVLGGSVADTLVVSGDVGTPTGEVAFFVCAPHEVIDHACESGGSPIGSSTLVDGATISPSFVPTSAGLWCFRAEYLGDDTYLPSTDGSTTECFQVERAAVAVSTLALPNGAGVAVGTVVADTATVTGLGEGFPVPTGDVAFHLCGPDEVTSEGCPSGGLSVGSSPLDAGGATTSPTTDATQALGSYCWRAEYAGDANYLPATHTNAASECFVVEKVDLALAKSVDPTQAAPGDEVTFTLDLSVTGAGTAHGVVVRDTVPERSTLVSCGGCVSSGTTPGSTLDWALGDLAAPDARQVSFVVVLDPTFPSGVTTISNVASVASDETGEVPSNVVVIDVTATPALGLVKAVDAAEASAGDLLTYTLTYYNEGNGDVSEATLTDAVPEGAEFVSCTGDCVHAGGIVAWTLSSIPALTSAEAPAGSVTLTVRVIDGHGCAVCNVALLASPQQDDGLPVSSEVVCVTIVPDVDLAVGAGSALVAAASFGDQAPLLGEARSAQSGAGDEGASGMLHQAQIENVLVDLGTFASHSSIATGGATTLSLAELVGVSALDGAVTATTLRAVAEARATSGGAAVSSAGSAVEGLRILGVPVDVAPGDIVPLPAALFGAGSYVAVLEREAATQAPEGASGGEYASTLRVAALRIHVTDALPLEPGDQPLEIVLASAEAATSFPQETLCEPAPTTSADARAAALVAGDAVVGATDAPALGGAHAQQLAGADVGIARIGASSSGSETTLGENVTATAFAEAADVCLVASEAGCAVVATLARAQANAVATGGESTVDALGTRIVGLRILDTLVEEPTEPGQVLEVPGVGFLVVDERTEGAGAITVRALRLVATEGPLAGTQVVVGEATASAAAA